jgi:small-conductance mechanosensitive channel
MVTDWYTITFQSLQSLWHGFLVFIPKLIGAIIVFLIGWFISIGIGKLIAEILKRLKFNRLFEKGVWKEALEKAEFKVDASEFIGAIIKWILVIVFLLAAVEILGLVQFADFLNNVLKYLPNVIVAVLIFVVAVIIAEFVEKIVRAAVEGVKVGYGQIVGIIAKWSIWIFAILAILIQLKIATQLILTLFTGLVAMIALAGGIAFGLGGKEVAGGILENLKKKFKE